MAIKRTLILCLVLLALSAVSCCVAREGKTFRRVKKTTPYTNQIEQSELEPLLQQLETVQNGNIFIEHHYDLKGKEIDLNEGCTLVFKGGSFCNGSVRGNNTKIKYKGEAIFDNVRISGTWVVKNITTDMFRDLSYINSLADVLALANEEIYNHVEIKDYGYDYQVRVTSVGVYEAPLRIKSNTDIKLDGTISLLDNNLFQYRIMLLNNCKNVKIIGNGGIKGDRVNHDYSIDDEHKAWKSHEWGHGIKISNSNNIVISEIFVNDCTGDSFSVGENSENISFYGVTSKGSRRQGITIAVASDITINKCIFQDIGVFYGTDPGAAIDVEPDNTECEIKNILIKNCEISNCRNGIISYSKGYGTTWTDTVEGKLAVKRDGRHYVNIKVQGCSINGVQDAFSLIGWDNGEIVDCSISDVNLFVRATQNLTVKGNKIECKYFIPHNTCIDNCSIFKNTISLKNNTELTLKKSTWNKNNVYGQSRVTVRLEE